MLRQFWEGGPRRDPNTIAYVVLLVAAIFFPILVNVITGGNSSAIMTIAADAGVYVLLAVGLNVVIGFAGLLDLGYVAFFAIGAYTYAFLASDHGRVTPLGEPIHLPFWIVLFIAMFVAASFGVILGAPTLRVREDEVAAAAMGVNTVAVKLLAFSIGAAFSGFAGTFYAAKLSLVSSENFGFSVSITIIVMIVLGGMGNIPGVITGALLIYGVIFILLPQMPEYATGFANSVGLSGLTHPSGDFPGIGEFISRLKFLIFGFILVVVMLVRPQGLLPSRQREQELQKGIAHEDTVIEDVTAEVGG